jgi:hypothetical protein
VSARQVFHSTGAGISLPVTSPFSPAADTPVAYALAGYR